MWLFGGGYTPRMNLILGILALILIIAGVIQLLNGAVVFGIILILVGLLLGPGGIAYAGSRRRI